jgi:hypothetical protein
MSGIIGTLIGIIVTLIIVGLIYWVVQQLLPLLPIPEPFAKIINILLMVILVLIVLWVILVLLGAAGVHVPGPFRWTSVAGRSFAAFPASPSSYL